MFTSLIELYRELGRPPVEDGGFRYIGSASDKVHQLLKELNNIPNHQGSIDVSSEEKNNINIDVTLPSNEYGKYYLTVKEFIKNSPSLENGKIPDNYYIYDINYESRDNHKPKEIYEIERYCEFIRLLSLLAIDSSTSRDGGHHLIFMLNASNNTPPKTITLRTSFDESILGYTLQKLPLLRALLSEDEKNKVHIEERQMIMRVAIADFLNQVEDEAMPFVLLVKNWNKVVTNYFHDLQSFLNSFSFEKIRKEIATTEADHITKLSGILNDITGKILALPISIAGIILLLDTPLSLKFYVYLIGICTASIILLGIIANQWLQVKRLGNSFDLIFSQYSPDKKRLPASLRRPIEIANKSMKTQKTVLIFTFLIFAILSLTPAIGGVAYYIYKRYTVTPDATISTQKINDNPIQSTPSKSKSSTIVK